MRVVSLNHICDKLSDAMDVMQDFETYEPGESAAYSPFLSPTYTRLYKHLRKVEKVLRDIEWAIDGEISIADAERSVKNFLNNVQRNKKRGN